MKKAIKKSPRKLSTGVREIKKLKQKTEILTNNVENNVIVLGYTKEEIQKLKEIYKARRE